MTTPVELAVLGFLLVDVLMKLREWVMMFLDSKKDVTDDTPVQLLRKDRQQLRDFLKQQTTNQASLSSLIGKVAFKLRLLLTKIDPEGLAAYDAREAARF